MSSLKEARSLAEDLQSRAEELVGALEGDVDFRAVVRLADGLGESADRLASTFAAVDAAVAAAAQRLGERGREATAAARAGARRGGRSRQQADGSSASKEALYKRARRAQIPGRSEMSKDELEHALERAAADRSRKSTRGD